MVEEGTRCDGVTKGGEEVAESLVVVWIGVMNLNIVVDNDNVILQTKCTDM